MPLHEIPKGSDIKRLLQEVWKTGQPYKLNLFFIFLFITLAQGLSLVVAYFVGRLATTLSQGFTQTDSLSLLLGFILPIPLIQFAGWLLWRASGFSASATLPKISHDLRLKAYDAIDRQSYRFFSDHFAGSLISRGRALEMSCRDVWDIAWWSFWPLLVTFTASLVIMSQKSLWLGVMCASWLGALLLLNVIVGRKKLLTDKARAAKATQLTGQFSDAVTNSMNVSVFNGHEFERSLIGKTSLELNVFHKRSWRIMETNFTGQNIANTIFAIGILWYVFHLWTLGQISVGYFVFIQGVMMNLFNNTQQLGVVLRRLYESSAEAKEILEIIDLEPEILDKRGAKPLKYRTGNIDFHHVTFKYHDALVLQDFAVSISPKEKIALVGPSGAGKSTITKLLLRFFDLKTGSILIDGQDISKVTQKSLREHIALVPQESTLFHRSLKDNIRYGRRAASDKEVIAAAKKARCHEFISKLPLGYDTLVGERGIKLSGGERQRVAIARAILKDAPILILDEATSSLDSESEHLIQDALHALMQNKTVIVIAHRLSTIMEMDRIIVMQDGKVVDQGSHDDLRQKVGIYQKLWNIQAGGFANDDA